VIADAASRRRILFVALVVGTVAIAAVAALAFLALKPRTLAGRHIDSAVLPRASEAASTAAPRATAPAPRLFSAKSFWNAPVNDEQIDRNSAALVQALSAEVQKEIQSRIGPWIATNVSSTTFYRVAHDQRAVRVKLDAGGTPGEVALQKAFRAVPIPKDAKPSAGVDRHMTIWQPSTDRLWEFWQARRAPDGWHASWGGAIRNVSESPGYYTASAWPGARRNWGATASSLPVIGGVMTATELSQGRIDHALAINLPAPRAGMFAWPAQRTDGTGDPTTLPEGARLRLDPALDIESLNLPPVTKMIALAAQRYGMVVRDQTHKGISLFAQDPHGADGRAYTRLFARQSPLDYLSKFPWDRLQVLRMHLCTHAPCRAR
jgi:hypothetical protein